MIDIETLVASTANEFGVTEEYVRRTVATLGRVTNLQIESQHVDGTMERRLVAPGEHEVTRQLAAEARECVRGDLDVAFNRDEYDGWRTQGPEAFSAELDRRLREQEQAIREG